MNTSMHKVKYVLGFMFNPPMTRVALIRKTKPTWQAGKLNGIGGKIEPVDMSPAHAMVREFEEETGAKTDILAWRYLGQMQGKDWQVYVFAAVGFPDQLQSVTEEKIEVLSLRHATENDDVIDNIPWLVQLAVNCLDAGKPMDFIAEYP